MPTRPNTWLKYKNKKLHFSSIPIPHLPTPFYLYSETALEDTPKKLKSYLKGIDFKICFSVKSNSNLFLLKKLTSMGLGLDLVSGGELYRAKKLNIPGSDIVYSGVGKTEEEIKDALLYQKKKGIYAFLVESKDELEKINTIAKKLNVRASYGFRFNPDIDAKTHPYISTGLKENKFGLDRTEIFEILKSNLKDYSHCKLTGISIHIGSLLSTFKPIEAAFESLSHLCVELEKQGHDLKFLDVGGGLGVSYSSDQKPPELKKYCQLIKKYFGSNTKHKKKRIILEPGRSITANAGILVSKVTVVKKRKYKNFVILDASMTELLRPSLYQAKHEIFPVDHTIDAKKSIGDYCGPVCESSDFFLKNQKIPNSLRPGDLVSIASCGAYGYTMSSNYNTRPKPAEYFLTKKGKIIEIKKRQTYEDLLKGEKT